MSKSKNKKSTVIARYPGQRILIGEGIFVRVSEVEGKRVYVYVETDLEIDIKKPEAEEDRRDRELGRQSFDFKSDRAKDE